MKAPVQIYVDDLAVINDLGTKISVKPIENFSSYIRKDALLEWAKECFRLQDSGSWYSNGAADAFSKLIDKLNEM